MRKYNNKKNTNKNIEDIINIKNLTKTAYNYLRNYREFHNEMDKNMLNMKFNNKNIVSKIDVTFVRKNKYITKDIYIIMTDFMTQNIINKSNIQYFIDVTYYATPPNNKKFKILIILAFNRDSYNTILCNISIISNENKETFISIFNYLKNKYSFNLNSITIDYSLAEYNAIKTVFQNCQIIPCFFHFIQNISKRIINLKSKNLVKKKAAKNLLANMKLLAFVPLSVLDTFYNLIKSKFKNDNKKLFNILINIIWEVRNLKENYGIIIIQY